MGNNMVKMKETVEKMREQKILKDVNVSDL